jgi:hypothetical protein
MTRKSGFTTWPPLWTTTRLDPNDKPTGEIGTLEKVLMNELFDNKIFMIRSVSRLSIHGRNAF